MNTSEPIQVQLALGTGSSSSAPDEEDDTGLTEEQKDGKMLSQH